MQARNQQLVIDLSDLLFMFNQALIIIENEVLELVDKDFE
jgi:hypothetical protein